MRLVTYEVGAGPRAGVLRGDVVQDVWGVDAPVPPAERCVGSLLRAGLVEQIEPAGPELALADVRLLPPVLNPGKIVCIGLNYRSHAEEAGLEPPEVPTFFAKFPNALTGHGATVALPSYSEKVDFEAEVAFVIGGRCKDVPEREALRYVAGYMLFNDLSARDQQFRTPQWMPGKVFDGSAPCGPALVTPDEAGDPIEIALTLNGETMQSASTADLMHGVPSLVAHLSGLMTLEPGDVVATGTPAGVGSVRTPRVWLEPGDELVVSSPTLGELRTSLA